MIIARRSRNRFVRELATGTTLPNMVGSRANAQRMGSPLESLTPSRIPHPHSHPMTIRAYTVSTSSGPDVYRFFGLRPFTRLDPRKNSEPHLGFSIRQPSFAPSSLGTYGNSPRPWVLRTRLWTIGTFRCQEEPAYQRTVPYGIPGLTLFTAPNHTNSSIPTATYGTVRTLAEFQPARPRLVQLGSKLSLGLRLSGPGCPKKRPGMDVPLY